ncbi:hypothetical protein SZN_26736 [Streptomyces zinciresistens K42]|uniref:Uncharacterized protein n=1 Tax=Streptomyces zinciresistens K42 TaxID=700597 RepID=G2GIK7_9ACTN|nr:hypothetical protein [Streptomyces zinciresistens]EGX56667.1 hypothetical protein SZN_26736 [Streptomyces zinciresistens K42]
MEPGLITDWAVWGKEPGTDGGYRVLFAHPPDRSADFNGAIHHWSPGTPAHGEQLPWITVGSTRQPDGTPAIGVFLLDSTDALDHAGRPIYRITHLAFRHDDVHAAGLGWYALARAALDAAPRLAGQGGGPAVLPFSPADQLLGTIGPLVTSGVSDGPLWLAAAAARLLDGTLVVTGAGDWKPLDLLLVLDTVAALLPFGMRATLSAATRTSSGSDVRMRLYWGNAADPGRACMVWGQKEPDLGGLSPRARSYHDLLISSWTEHGGERVLRHLADAREPLDIADPFAHLRARDVLAALNPALAVAQEVREGHEVTGDRIDMALSRPTIDPDTLAVLATRKLADASPDLTVLAAHMADPATAGKYRAKLITDLLGHRTDVARGNFESMRAALPDTRDGLHPLDGALACVIEDVRVDHAPEAADPVAEQLLPVVAPFTPGTMTLTQSLLRGVPGLAGRLVRALYAAADPAPGLRAWLAWLCDSPGAEIAGHPELPLLLRLLTTGSAPDGAHRKWAAAHPEAAARLLEGAVVCGRADHLLTQDFLNGLLDSALRIAAAPAGAPARSPLARTLTRRSGALRPETAARWDVLCALAGLTPSGFTSSVAAAAGPGSPSPAGRVDTYLCALQADLDTRSVRPYADAVVERLLGAVLAVDGDSGEGPGPAARHLTSRVLDRSGSCAEIVARAVRRLATESPGWNETPEDQEWLRRTADRLPGLRSALGLRELHRAALRLSDSPQDCEELAARARAARGAGAEHDGVCAALEVWARRGRAGGRVVDFVAAYDRQWARYAGDDRALEEREHLEHALARRGRDNPVLRQYCDHAIRQLTSRRSEASREIRRLQQEQHLFDQEISRLRRLDASAHRTHR